MLSLKSSKLQKLLKDAGLIIDKNKSGCSSDLLPKVTKTDVDLMFSSVLARELQLANQSVARTQSVSARPSY
jgi:hypothetical protein